MKNDPPVPVGRDLTDDEKDLFGEFEFLIPIVIEGKDALVPEKNTVLRALQYVEINEGTVKLDWPRYCWNNTEGCCEFSYLRDGKTVSGRACLIQAEPGLEIVQLPKGGRLCSKAKP